MPSQPTHAFTYGVLTISDGASRGYRVDTSGEAIESTLTNQGFHLRHREVVPDDTALITGWLRRWAPHVDLIVTTGGTGLGPRDVTPEATMRAIERPVPGLAEALRDETRRKTPLAALSRGVAGILGRCLIVNLPGSPKAVGEYLDVLLPVLPHALDTVRGDTSHDPSQGSRDTHGHRS